MGNCASGAKFTGRPVLGVVTEATIYAAHGKVLKMKCSTADVESYGEENGKRTSIKPARSIVDSSVGFQCLADLAHGSNHGLVRARIRCSDDSWSDWVAVDKPDRLAPNAGAMSVDSTENSGDGTDEHPTGALLGLGLTKTT